MAGASAKEENRCVLEIIEESRGKASRTLSETRSADGRQNSSEESRGVVTWFDDRKGYGFITMEDGTDVFMHRSSIRGGVNYTLVEGDRVTFQVMQDEKGLKATNVTKTGL